MQFGPFQKLVSVPGYVHDLKVQGTQIESSIAVSAQDVSQRKPGSSNSDKTKDQAQDESTANRGRHDLHNLSYYISTMGKGAFGVFLLLVALQVAFTALQCKFYFVCNNFNPADMLQRCG